MSIFKRFGRPASPDPTGGDHPDVRSEPIPADTSTDGEATDAAVADTRADAAVDPDPASPHGAARAHERLATVRRRVRTVAAVVITILAGLLVWFALVGPDQISRFSLAAFVRIPIEGLVGIAILVLLPRRTRIVVAALAGTVLGVLTVVKIVDMGFFEAINRPFNPTADWSYFQSAQALLTLAVGRTKGHLFLITAIVLGVAVVVLTPLAVVRLVRIAARHRTTSLRTVTVLGVVWVLCAVFGAQFVSGTPVASSTAAGLAYNQVRAVHAGLIDKQTVRKEAANDPARTIPTSNLLTGLRGKDVLIVFIESYGRTAIQDSSFSPPIDAELTADTNQLTAAGFSAKSAFLTSPTFGGISWLAHATLQSGLKVDNQQTYNDLVATDRFTLSDAFHQAGWRTVADAPANEKSWPEGKTFYHYDQIYDQHNVGYTGPNFSYATVPDQYTYAALQRLELDKPHTPVMAEIDTVSSHTPWAPLPRMVDPSQLGDGSIFDGMPAQGQSPLSVWPDANKVRVAYGQSIQYSLDALLSFVQTSPDKNLVVIMLGDHQPSVIVSGQHADHDVPISIIARDPAVINRISGWSWQDGLLPNPQAPVWPMAAFRDRFLTAYDS